MARDCAATRHGLGRQQRARRAPAEQRALQHSVPGRAARRLAQVRGQGIRACHPCRDVCSCGGWRPATQCLARSAARGKSQRRAVVHPPWWRLPRNRSAARSAKSVCGVGAACRGAAGAGAACLTRDRSGRLVSWTAISRNSAQNIPVPQAAPAAGPSPMRTPPRPLPPLAAPPRAPPAPSEPDINTFQVLAAARQRPAGRAPTLQRLPACLTADTERV